MAGEVLLEGCRRTEGSSSRLHSRCQGLRPVPDEQPAAFGGRRTAKVSACDADVGAEKRSPGSPDPEVRFFSIRKRLNRGSPKAVPMPTGEGGIGARVIRKAGGPIPVLRTHRRTASGANKKKRPLPSSSVQRPFIRREKAGLMPAGRTFCTAPESPYM